MAYNMTIASSNKIQEHKVGTQQIQLHLNIHLVRTQYMPEIHDLNMFLLRTPSNCSIARPGTIQDCKHDSLPLRDQPFPAGKAHI
jgi:hypothetical protein